MIINNNTLKKLLEEKEELVTQGRALTGDIEKLEKERAKIGMQIQKRKDKIIPLVEKAVKPLLGEYEDIETVTINKSGEVEVKVFNHMEEFKKAYAEKFAPQAA
jgi:recombinational DNA repair ATPase RecF